MTVIFSKRFIRAAMALFSMCALLALVQFQAFAETNTTPSPTVGSGAGTCNEAALHAAVAAAPNGQTITFNCGANPVTITLTQTLVVRSAITIDGGNKITLSGGGSVTVIQSYSPMLTLRNLTIADGYSNGGDRVHTFGGAGVQGMWQSNLTVINCRFNNNVTNNLILNPGNPVLNEDHGGGGIFIHTGTLDVRESTFTNNRVINGSGGGIHALWSNVSISNSTFEGNQAAGFGGAFYNDGVLLPSTNGYIRVTGSRFINNTAQGQGGATFFWLYSYDNAQQAGSYVSVDSSLYTGNQVTANWMGAGLGGGIRAGNGPISVSNTTLNNNLASHQGGAVWMGDNGDITLTNVTMSGNRAQEGSSRSGLGGGITLVNTRASLLRNVTLAENHAGDQGGAIYSTTTPITLQNTLLYNNTASNTWGGNLTCGLTYGNGGGNLQYPHAGGRDRLCTPDIRVADARLQELANNGGLTPTRALPGNSPAVDTGVCALAADQRGIVRPQGAGCDVGAFELGQSGITLSAPPNTISHSLGNPTYTWTDVGANSYDFYLDNSANDGQPFYYAAGLSDSTYCNGETCSFDPTSLSENARLANGAYVVYIRGTTNGVPGSVAGPFTFALNAPAPSPVAFGATSGTNTTRPTVSWSLPASAANATWFHVFLIKKALFDSAVYTPTADVWLSRAQVCGSISGTNCILQSAVDLEEDVAYILFIQSYGPGGLSTGGAQYNNGWAGVEFTVNQGANPAVPVVNVNRHQGRPTISWPDQAAASHYYVYVRNQATSATHYLQWHVKNDICGNGGCSITPESLVLGNGTYEAYVYACGSGGCSQGGPYNNGWGGGSQGGSNATFSYNYAPPELVPTNGMSFTYANGTATVEWQGVERASWYSVFIGTAGGASTAYLQWLSSDALDCPDMGTCRASIPLNLPPGDYYLAVQSAGPGGWLTVGGAANNGYQVLETAGNVP
ncbi:MAG: choice-of-anchor Q domain-containing protein [bacterium]|nr:choice-of-anchor Q domain-containing protein [bacterium]